VTATLTLDLTAAIARADAARAVAVLRGKTEAERSAAAARMEAIWEDLRKRRFTFDRSGTPLVALAAGTEVRDALEVAAIAVLGTTSRIPKRSRVAWARIPADDAALAVLRDRRPAWLPAWAEFACEARPDAWTIVRALVREGLLPRPTSDTYILGFVRWAADEWRDAHGLPTRLAGDPALFEHEVWRIFEVEGNRDISLTGTARAWMPALLLFAADGRMERGRMLDASLDALARDFAQHKAGFYSRLHEALAPTPKERAARAEKYLGLLSSRIGPTVSLAVGALKVLADAKALDDAAFVEVAPAARAARSAAAVGCVVTILGAIAGRSASLRGAALGAAAAFLESPSAEVQGAIVSLLEAHPDARDAALLAQVKAVREAVAASVRKRLDAWLGEAPNKTRKTAAAGAPKRVTPAVGKAALAGIPKALAEAAGVGALEKAITRGQPWPRVSLDGATSFPRLDPTTAQGAIATHEELFDEVAHAMEARDDVMLAERVLAGISLLGAPRAALPKDRVKPVARRAAALVRRRSDSVAPLVDAWLRGVPLALPEQTAEWQRGPLGFLARRLVSLAARLVRDEPRALLSAPTHRPGWISATTLEARARALGTRVWDDPEDAALAMLRRAPDGRTPTTLGKAGARGRVAVAPSAGEVTLRYERVTHSWGKRVQLVARTKPPLPKRVDPLQLGALLHTPFEAWGLGAVRALASCALLAPDAFLARGACVVQANLEWSEAEWHNAAFLEPLAEPDTHLGHAGLVLLAMGLGAKEAREQGLAVDALIAAIADGRVVGPDLGEAMAILWDPLQVGDEFASRPSASRWAKTLGVAARMSALHSEVVRRALEALVGGGRPAGFPPDLQALLAFWRELCHDAETGVAAADARAVLEGLAAGGKVKALRAELLARPAKESALAAEAGRLAMEGRLARARRWAAWQRA
jgi:hypothetical protein